MVQSGGLGKGALPGLPLRFPVPRQAMQINLMPDLSLLAVMAIFIVNYFIVKRFLIGPINGVLELREAEARSAQEIYEQSLGRFNAATAEMEQRIHEAKRYAAQLRDRFRGEAGAHRGSMIERTTAEARKLVAEAEERLKGDVKEARDKIVREAESLAQLAAERILGRAV
jgi:F-type H+-transporting ATPase subunit b